MSQTVKKKPDVNTPCAAYEEMVAASALPRTLMGGTPAMREAGRLYLPQEPSESSDAYQVRLARSFLFNQYGKTVSDLGGRLFRTGAQTADLPAELEPIMGDIDLTGRDLTRFARDLFSDGVHAGVTYLLVEYPTLPEEETVDDTTGEVKQPRPRSIAEEKQAGLRPYWVHIKQVNLIGWRSEIINGMERLTQVRIRETVEEEDGLWDVKSVPQVRVLEIGRWAEYRQDESEEWVIHAQGTTTLDFIPLIPIYTNRTGFMTGRPLLENLAELNLCHWQSSSDQRHILHVARCPILFGAGFSEDSGRMEIGPTVMVKNSNAEAKLTFVEHTGKAIEAGANDLKELEAQMKVCAMEPLMPKSGGQTATAKAIDTAEAACLLQTIANDLEDCLELALIYSMALLGQTLDTAGTVEFDCNFSATLGQQADLDALNKARANRDISRKTYQKELKRRDVLSEDFDSALEEAELTAEGPDLNLM